MKKLLFKLEGKLSLKLLIIGAFFLLIAGYALYQTRDIIRGPDIVIVTPSDGTTSADGVVEIEGQALRIARLFLNNGPIFTDEAGRFNHKLLLARGYNLITLEAQDKFGRTVKKTINLVYN